MWKLSLGLVIGLVMAESLFWLRDGGAFPHLNIYRSDPSYGVTLLPDAETRIAFAGNPATDVRTNARGYRGDDWDDQARGQETLVLGDSQVFGLGVAEEDTFSVQLGRLLGEPVRNLGVPTFGPLEYTDLLDVILADRHPRRVVYVVNLANDLFELERPNRARHVAWDQWAVRIETAPDHPLAFPARAWLMSQSHLVFAVRSLLSARAADDAGFASEGSWRDIAQSARDTASALEKSSAAVDVVQTLRTREQLSERWSTLQERVINEFSRLARDREDYAVEAKRLAGYRGDPRDILHNPYAESGRPVAFTAHQLMRAAIALDENTGPLAALAEQHHDGALAQLLVERRKVRDALIAQGGAFAAAPTHPALARVLERTALACNKAGAALYVVALPLDVQVSRDEWAKYDQPARDLGPSEALLDLVTRTAEAVGATLVNPLETLRDAEPGAFLDGDLHLSAQGHRVIAEQLATAMREPRPSAALRLPAGRSFPPTHAEWSSASQVVPFEADRASCTARSAREWVRLACFRHAGEAPLNLPRVLVLRRGGHGDAMLSADDEAMTISLPLLLDDSAEGELSWPDLTRSIRLARDPQGRFSVQLGPLRPRPSDQAAAEPAQYTAPRVEPVQLSVTSGSRPFDRACLDALAQKPELGVEPPACAIDSPQRESACGEGQVAFGTTRRCAARCAADGSCPPDLHCEIFAAQAACVGP